MPTSEPENVFEAFAVDERDISERIIPSRPSPASPCKSSRAPLRCST